MTKREIREEVVRRLRESAAPTFWSEADVNASIDDGYEEISDASEWYERRQTIALLPRRPYYDMRRVATSEFLVAGPAYNNTTSRWLIPATVGALDQSDNRWEARISEPDRIVVRGVWFVMYWPFKGVAAGSVKQYYAAIPPQLEDDEEPGFHDACHYGLVEYALFDLFAQDAEADLAYSAWKEYTTYEAALIAHTTGRASVPKVHAHRSSTND